MTASTFRWDRHRQDGSFWTKEERDKGIFVAKRALKAGGDAVAAVKAYMGMDDANAEICAKRAKLQLNQSDRRTVHP